MPSRAQELVQSIAITPCWALVEVEMAPVGWAPHASYSQDYGFKNNVILLFEATLAESFFSALRSRVVQLTLTLMPRAHTISTLLNASLGVL